MTNPTNMPKSYPRSFLPRHLSLAGLLSLFLGAPQLADSQQYVPYYVQGQGWRTQFTLVNTCDEPKHFRIEFYDSQNQPAPVIFVSAEQRQSHLDSREDHFPQSAGPIGKNRWLHAGVPGNVLEPGELLLAYGVFTEDGEGCITGYSSYVNDVGGDSFSSVQPLLRVSDGWVVAFSNANFDQTKCFTTYALSGPGDTVILEAYDRNGNFLGSHNLGSVFLSTFPIGKYFPADQNTFIDGFLRIRGQSTVHGFRFCDGRLTPTALVSLPMKKGE